MIDDMRCCGDNINAVTRRGFLVSLMVSVAAACAGPTRSSSARRERELLDEAMALGVTVDLLSHPGPLFEPKLQELGEPVAADMRTGRIDAAVFAAVPLYPLIRIEPSGRRTLAREPRPGELFEVCQEQLDKVTRAARRGIISIALSPAEIIAAKRTGVPCAVLGSEGADLLDQDLSRLRALYGRGVRHVQLVHRRANHLGDSQDDQPRHGGLTPFGRDVVREMNRLGMIIDLAHATPETVRGVVAESRHPVICSHTGPYAVRPLRRHLTDDVLKVIATRGGIIGVWPFNRPGETFDHFLREIDHVKSVVGIDHVGVGLDLFGLPSTVLPTHKEFALVPAGLLSRGYSQADVAKVCGGNFMRVFLAVTETRG